MKQKNQKEQRKRFSKSKAIADLLDSTIDLLSDLGIPVEKMNSRLKQRVAMAFLALAGVKTKLSEITQILSLTPLRSRDVLQYWNVNFEETLKDSSYDDVRSENLSLLVLAGIAINVGDMNGGAKNDSRRRFTLNNDVVDLFKFYGTSNWHKELSFFKENHRVLREELERKRNLNKVAVTLPHGLEFKISSDPHNILQKAILEDFLPNFCKAPKVLYFGDAEIRTLHSEKEILEKLKFFDILHEELIDIIAWDEVTGWIFLIEAFNSTGAWDELRILKIKDKLPHLINSLVFVTAFLNRETFRSVAADIAWETEVWIADNPEHLIHYNGDKFLGPHTSANQ